MDDIDSNAGQRSRCQEGKELTLVIIIVGIIGAALTFWNGANWYGFVSGYRYLGEFQGKRYECRLKFATSECDRPTVCALLAPMSPGFTFCTILPARDGGGGMGLEALTRILKFHGATLITDQ